MRLSANTMLTAQDAQGVTTQDLDLYIAPSGSDVTGDGSANNPYASLSKVAEFINPLRILHKVRVFLLAPPTYYAGNPSLLNLRTESTGSISFIGVGNPVATAGPYTVTGVTDLGATGSAGHSLTTAGLVAKELHGSYIRILTGTATGMIFPVSWNTTTTIDIRNEGNTKPTNGCTFEVIDPAVTIRCDRPMVINCQNLGDLYNNPLGTFTYAYARVAFINLTFDFSHMDDTGTLSIMGNGTDAGIAMPFVKFSYSDTQFVPFVCNACSLNYHLLFDDSIGIASQVVGSNLLLEKYHAGTIINTKWLIYFVGDMRFCSDVITYGLIGCSCIYLVLIVSSNCGMSLTGGSYLFQTLYFHEGEIFVGFPIISTANTSMLMNHSYFDSGLNCIDVAYGSFVNIDDTACSATGITDVAVLVNGNCRVIMSDGCLSMVGAAGAYTFQAVTPNVVKAIWPLVGTGETDGIGSFVTYPASLK